MDPAALAALFDQAADGFLVFDAAGRLVLASRTALELFGIASRSAFPEAMQLASLAPEFVAAAAEGAPRPVTIEGTSERADGSLLLFALDAAATRSPAGALYFTGVLRDVTKARQEQKLKAALYEVAEAGNRDLPFPEFLSIIDEALCRLFRAPNFFIALVDRERGTLAFPHVRDRGVQDTREIPQERLRKTLTALVLRSGRPLLVDGARIRELADAGEIILLGDVPKVWLGVPLAARGETIGLVSIQSYGNAADIDQDDLALMAFISAQIAGAICRKRDEEALRVHAREAEEARERIERQAADLARAHDRLRGDLRIAAKLQRSRLPRVLPDLPGIEFAWMFEACEDVAGDMFNVIPLDDDRVAIYVLDVSGHGVPAAFLSMTLSRMLTDYNDGSGILRTTRPSAEAFASPSVVADRLNRRFPMTTDVGQFFTLFYGILHLSDRRLDFVSAGHPDPVVVRGRSVDYLVAECGPAIGILADAAFPVHSVEFAPGDALVVATDGIEEACDPDGRHFGLRRTLETVRDGLDKPLAGLVQGMKLALADWRRGTPPSDDATILAFRFT